VGPSGLYGVIEFKLLRGKWANCRTHFQLNEPEGVAHPGDPVKAVSPKRVAELSVELHNAGDEELGRQIAVAAERAEKANRSTK
jgi:hypothetical protein